MIVRLNDAHAAEGRAALPRRLPPRAALKHARENRSAGLAASLLRGFVRRFRLLRYSDRVAALTFELGTDIVVDPLLIPPLHRQHGDPVQIDSKVQMIAGGQAGLAGLADDLPLLDRIAGLDVDGTQVTIKRMQPKAVIQNDGIAVNTQIADEGDNAAVGGFDRIMLGD